MSERDGFQHGVPCWVDTWQPDADAAMSFYTQIFGWEAEDTMPDGVEGTHYICRLRGRDVAAIASRPEASPDDTAWTTYVWVETSTRLSRRCATRAAGSSGSRSTPRRWPDRGHRRPRRRRARVWAAGQRHGRPARQRAERLFDERADDQRPRGGEALLQRGLRLGHRELRHGRRRDGDVDSCRATSAGSRSSRSRATSSRRCCRPSANGGATPHWGVDFWIADVEQAAAKVAELGGQVLAPPYDIPNTGLRQGVFMDPQGATFSLTQPPGA